LAFGDSFFVRIENVPDLSKKIEFSLCIVRKKC